MFWDVIHHFPTPGDILFQIMQDDLCAKVVMGTVVFKLDLNWTRVRLKNTFLTTTFINFR